MFRDTVRYTSEEGIDTIHCMIRHNESKGLFIVLPGANNAPDRPLLYLVRKGMLDAGYDVLNIDYTRLINKEEDFDRNADRILEVVNGVLLQRLEDYRGLHVCLLCRSLGSVVGTRLAEYPFMKLHRAVIVSPVNESIEYIGNQAYRIFLDPKDKYIDDLRYSKLLDNDDIELREYHGAGHNFEFYNDIERTIDTLKAVVVDILSYLSE